MRVLLAILVSIPLLSFSQERSIEASLDRDEILIGEQVTMTITLKSHAADTIQWPLLEDTLRAEIEIIEQSKFDTAFLGNDLSQKVLTRKLLLTSFDSGYFVIRPLIAMINGEQIESNPLLLTVQTIEIDTSKGIADIKPIAEVPFAWKEWLSENWQWFVGIAAFLAILTWALLRMSKEKPQIIVKREEPKIPPHQNAWSRLMKLKKDELWQKGKIKEYYSELTDILREYIEHRFLIPALEQTSDEIIQSMKRSPDFNGEQIDQIKRLLFLADLVKFAKENPIGQENETHFDTVKSFIDQTVPSPEAEQKEEENNG